LKGPLQVISRRLSPRRLATVAVLVASVASVWFALAMTWGLFGPVNGSHAVLGARAIAGENMLTWGVWGPVSEYSVTRPLPQAYEMEQPWGAFWLARGLMKVFGRHAYVPRLESVLMSIATPPLLYAIGRALWGPLPAALSALAYVVVPIALAFGNSPGFEVELLFGCLLTAWGYIRFAERWKRRWLALSLLGVMWTANVEWEGSVFLAVVLGWFLVTQYLLPGWFGRSPSRRFGQWWAFSLAILVVTIAGYTAYVVKIDAVDRILSFLAAREKVTLPFRQALKDRPYWISVAFTPIVIAVCGLAVPVFAFRLVLLRRTREIFPLALLATATATRVHVSGDSDSSFFLPLSFAGFWALSVGALAETWVAGGRWVLRHFARRDERGALPIAAFACFAVLSLAILPDGIRGLVHGRAIGGRFGADRSAALEWMSEHMKSATRVDLHASMRATRADEWTLHRPVAGVDALPARAARTDGRYFIGDLVHMAPADHGTLAAQFHVVAVGPFVLIDRTSPSAPADGYVLDARRPNALEWCLDSGVDPIITVRADPWYTWELREQFGQSPNPPPKATPLDPEELRVAHNIAVATGDLAEAAEYEARLGEQLVIYPAVTFTDGTRLLGERFTAGVAPTLDIYFAASGPAKDDIRFELESSIQKRPLLSLVVRDDSVRTVEAQQVVPPKLWKRGFIYVSRSEIRPRFGSEIFAGNFAGADKGRAPKPRNGSTNVRLLTLQ
jgi:hypothetical protein